MTVVKTSKCKDYISIHIVQPKNESFSWEQIQSIKDQLFPGLNFVELYPKNNNIINNANERHLIHYKNFTPISLEELERNCDIEHLELKF